MTSPSISWYLVRKEGGRHKRACDRATRSEQHTHKMVTSQTVHTSYGSVSACSLYTAIVERRRQEIRTKRKVRTIPPSLFPRVATPDNKSVHFDDVIHMQEIPPYTWFLIMTGRRSPFTRLDEHHGVPRLVQAMPAWSGKTRRVPSRHCRDARVYGHTTTAMHDMSTPPPPPTLVS